MTFEEEQEISVLEVLINEQEKRYRYQELQSLIGSIVGDSLQIIIDSLLAKGVLKEVKYVPKGYDQIPCNVVDGYQLTTIANNRLEHLRRKRRNERTATILLWVAACTGVIAALGSILMPIVTAKPKTSPPQT